MSIVALSYLIICMIRTILVVFTGNDILAQQFGLPVILMTIVSFIALFVTLYIEINKEKEELKQEVNMNNTERLTTGQNTLTIPTIQNTATVINFDSADNIIVKINNNEISIDKNKLETLLKTFALTKEELKDDK